MEHLVVWEGQGWYGDLGRADSDGKSYVEGRLIARPNEYDKTGLITEELEKTSPDSPVYIWDLSVGRGTPYWLESEPR